MTTQKDNCTAGGTSIVESGVQRLSAIASNEGGDGPFIRKVMNYHLLFAIGADPENGTLISELESNRQISYKISGCNYYNWRFEKIVFFGTVC